MRQRQCQGPEPAARERGEVAFPVLAGSLAIALILAVFWFSRLSIIPVPWPDDSAFYLVAKDLFSWPPRWVMLSQAPWEPSYAVWNFNTMPLFPVLLGLGRAVGISGIWAIKFWPLAFWALSGALLLRLLHRLEAPPLLMWLAPLLWATEPVLRWSSMIVRPESLIAACGMALMTELLLRNTSEGEADAGEGSGSEDDDGRRSNRIALYLALAAYTHFNAIHLVFPVLTAALLGCFGPAGRAIRELLKIGGKTLAFLSPWLLSIAMRPELFVQQLTLQWSRLAVPNAWFNSWPEFKKGVLEQMGSMSPWPSPIEWTAPLLLLLIVLSGGLFAGALLKKLSFRTGIAASWVLASVWLFHSKPEVWFTHYLHASVVVMLCVGCVESGSKVLLATAAMLALLNTAGTFLQWREITQSESWSWASYHRMVDCVDRQLTALEAALPAPEGQEFKVWVPTFPDITIELSQRHPGWRFTRTCDFLDRSALAIQHGYEVNAVVLPETYATSDAEIDQPAAAVPDMESVWMTWKGYFLNTLYRSTSFKPDRHVCQSGKWQAFIFH